MRILADHLKTLSNGGVGKIAYSDILLFYFIPIGLGAAVALLAPPLTEGVYSVSITAFAIFASLLLSVQMALFGIYQRGWGEPEDQKKHQEFRRLLKAKSILLKQLNTNISYLIIVSLVSVTTFVIFFAFSAKEAFESFMAVFLYSHFALTILMVVKRAHALFEKEYEV